MIPLSTRIPILLNKHKNSLVNLFNHANKALGANISDELANLLCKDLCFLLYHFYNKNKNLEYKVLFITVVIDAINEIQFNNDNGYVDILKDWKNLDTQKKEQFLSNTWHNISPQNNFDSILLLQENFSKKTSELTKDFLLDIAKDLINICDSDEPEDKEKLSKIVIKLNSSNKRIDHNEIKTYINQKFEDALLNNSEKIVESPSKIKELIISNQNKIVEIDKRYVLDFLKIHNFLKIKYQQIIKSLETINKDVKVFQTIDRLSTLIIEQVNSYNTVYYYSLNMLVGLLEGNFVVFYELYQQFDELGIFKSKFEKDLTTTLSDIKEELKTMNVDIVKKLTVIESQLEKVVSGINKINYNLNEVLNGLIYIEESISDGFNSLNNSIDLNFNVLNTNLSNGLNNLNSTVAFGNMINAISAYQLYKVNKNTKSLRP